MLISTGLERRSSVMGINASTIAAYTGALVAHVVVANTGVLSGTELRKVTLCGRVTKLVTQVTEICALLCHVRTYDTASPNVDVNMSAFDDTGFKRWDDCCIEKRGHQQVEKPCYDKSGTGIPLGEQYRDD